MLTACARARSLLVDAWIASVKASERLLPLPGGKIYDCFLFNNEIDLLRLRLLTLYDYVDYFVVCESATSFSGKPKPLFYSKYEDLFHESSGKIRHYIIPEPPRAAYVSNPANPSATTSEFWQRNQIIDAIRSARNSDLIMVSDVDEIPNPRQLQTVSKLCHYAHCTVFLKQSWHLLFLNVKVSGRHGTIFKSRSRHDNLLNDQWLGTFCCTAQKIRRHYRSIINTIWGMKWGSGFFSEQIPKKLRLAL